MSRKNNQNLGIDQLAMLLENLEQYIDRNKYFSNWKQREQFFNRTISINRMISLEIEEDFFFSFFSSHFSAWMVKEPKTTRQELQKEFYKWVDHSGITAENCPPKLKHFLNQINEILENGQSQLYQDYKAAQKKWDIFSLSSSPFFAQASQEVNKAFGFKNSSSEKEWLTNRPKYYAVKIEGNAEQGQKIFQQIKSSIVNQPEWDFTFLKNFYQKLKEKISELEEKGQSQPNQISPKDTQRTEIIIDEFKDILRDTELYISKLDYYPNWEVSKWTGEGEDYLLTRWKDESAEGIKNTISKIDFKCLSLLLRDFKRDEPNYYPHLVKELKVEFSRWQAERRINNNQVPKDLRRVLSTVNEILENNGNYWRGWKEDKEKEGNSENKQKDELAEIIVDIKLKVIELAQKYKVNKLGSQLDNWENKLKSTQSISEAKIYQQQLDKKIQEQRNKHQQQELENTNKNKLPFSVKLVIGTGIVLLIAGIVVIVWQIIKKNKVKK